ncbi:MAG: hypothetical protein WED04_13490 [Promethearchaeati archaeon SRVP18_Atabeyarchaeia-1]
MNDVSQEKTSEPWALMSKAENWRHLGLQEEAVTAADEAIEVQLKNAFDRLGVPKPTNREEAIRVLGKRGIKLPAAKLIRLSKIREKAGRSEEEGLTMTEVEEAISIAEESISRISEHQESAKGARDSQSLRFKSLNGGNTSDSKFWAGGTTTLRSPQVHSSDLMEIPFSRYREFGDVEPEFVTKLLLARAILNYREKRMPRLIGLTFVILSMIACSLFGVIGGSGLLLMLTGRVLLSVIGLAFDFMLVLVAYIFLRIALYVKRQTR